MKDTNSGNRIGAPIKIPLNYFPISAQNDDLLDEIEFKFGHIGVTFFLRIQRLIYGQKGFYYEVDIDNEQEWVFTLRKTNFDARDRYKIKGILQFLVKKDFFDANYLREKKILTSNAIQMFYFWATKRRVLANFNKEYFMPGVEDFIKKIRKLDEENENKIEDLLESGEGIYESVNRIMQSEKEGENGLPVFINSNDVDKSSIVVDRIQTKEKKRNEMKRKGRAFENSIEFPNPIDSSFVSTASEPLTSSGEEKTEKTKKKRAIPEEHRAIFIEAWEDFTGLAFTNDFDKNTAIVKIVIAATAFCRKTLARKELTAEKTERILSKQLHIVFRSVLKNEAWSQMPPTLNSHRDIVKIASRWDSLFGFVLNLEEKLRNPAQKSSPRKNIKNLPVETRKDHQRILDTQSILQIAQREEKVVKTKDTLPDTYP